MAHKRYVTSSKTARGPRRPYEKERMDNELKLVGEYGLRNKREVWRVQYTLAKLRASARHLLTLNENDPNRIFRGNALLKRLTNLGLLSEEEQKLDYVLGLTVSKLMERRLQTRVFKQGVAKSIHHARVLITHGHIRVCQQRVNQAAFMVRTDADKHIDFASQSSYATGMCRRKRKKNKGGDDGDAGAGEE